MKRIFSFFSCRNTSFKLFRLQQRDFGVRPGFKYRIFHSPAPGNRFGCNTVLFQYHGAGNGQSQLRSQYSDRLFHYAGRCR